MHRLLFFCYIIGEEIYLKELFEKSLEWNITKTETGDPTFSCVKVSTAAIQIDTYTVDNNGNVTLFDTFKDAHNKQIISKIIFL